VSTSHCRSIPAAYGEARRLRQLEHENTRLKRLVADLTLDNQALKELWKKGLAPVAQRVAVRAIQTKFGLSERRAGALSASGGPHAGTWLVARTSPPYASDCACCR